MTYAELQRLYAQSRGNYYVDANTCGDANVTTAGTVTNLGMIGGYAFLPAKPPPKCEPGCTAAAPCKVDGACPYWKEAGIFVRMTTRGHHRDPQRWRSWKTKRFHDALDEIGNEEMVEIRAANNWACDLVRARR